MKRAKAQGVSSHFPPHRDLTTLTVAELLRAREAWQVPLANMHNVIGTAIGLFRFRKDDKARVEPRATCAERRTLANSDVRPQSYPCILVLVRDWAPLSRFAAGDPSDAAHHVIPQFLYTEDGLIVPTCVVSVEISDEPDPGVSLSEISYPDNLFGSGCPLATVVQGEEHFGTAGCLVTDGQRRYLLSARHVTGASGQEVYTVARGRRLRIGSTSSKQVVEKRFSDVYPAWPSERTMCTLDAGLVDIDDVERWTSQVYELGDIERAADLNASNISMRLIGSPVKAYGARSQVVVGEIEGLFPRYKSVAGVDHVADLLIGPRKGAQMCVKPGDSGMVWLFDPPDAAPEPTPRLTPVAMNWGALELAGPNKRSGFAVATLLSNICQALGVDVAVGHNTGFAPVWGRSKHQSIASILCHALARSGGDLSRFILNGNGPDQAIVNIFKELAYVPDMWKEKEKVNGRKLPRFMGREKENPNHYANIDLTPKDKNRPRLESIQLSPKAWLEFYPNSTDPGNRGALPFRIAQVYGEMKKAIEKPPYDRFVCMAGVLMHYCADACNPAHVTRWGRGNPKWTSGQRMAFHGLWDSAGYDRKAVIDALAKKLRGSSAGGVGSAVERDVVDLMSRVQKRVSLQHFADGVSSGDKGCQLARDHSRTEQCRDSVAKCVIEGCVLWWKLVKSLWDTLGAGAAKRAKWNPDKEMLNIYKSPRFLPSLSLEDMAGGR